MYITYGLQLPYVVLRPTRKCTETGHFIPLGTFYALTICYKLDHYIMLVYLSLKIATKSYLISDCYFALLLQLFV